jgi:hypothetical protein
VPQAEVQRRPHSSQAISLGAPPCDAKTHLSLLLDAAEGDLIEIRAGRGSRWASRYFTDAETAVSHARDLESGAWHVHVSVQPRKRGTTRPGRADDVSAVVWFALDVDAHDDPTLAAPRRDRALEVAADLGLPAPTYVVASGRGHWLWWRLARTAATLATHDKLRALTRAFAARCDGIDTACTDLPRVARLAGLTRPDGMHTSIAFTAPNNTLDLDAVTLPPDSTILDDVSTPHIIGKHKAGFRDPSPHLVSGRTAAVNALSRTRKVKAVTSQHGLVHRYSGACLVCGAKRPDGSTGSTRTGWVTPMGGLRCFRPTCPAHTRAVPLRVWGAWVGAPYQQEDSHAAERARAATRRTTRDGAVNLLERLFDSLDCAGAALALLSSKILRLTDGIGGDRTLPGLPPIQGAREVLEDLAIGRPTLESALLATASDRTTRRMSDDATADNTRVFDFHRTEKGRRGGFKLAEKTPGAARKALALLYRIIAWLIHAGMMAPIHTAKATPSPSPRPRIWRMVPAKDPP